MTYEERMRPYCRMPGTRINAIMTMIERGVSLERIARRYGTTVETVMVYAKALKGELCEMAALDLETRIRYIPQERVDMVTADYKAGRSYADIARRTNLSKSQVTELIRRLHRDGVVEPKWHVIQDETLADVDRLHKAGLGPMKIAKELGIEHTRVKSALGRLRIIRIREEEAKNGNG